MSTTEESSGFVDIDDFANACFAGDFEFVKNNLLKVNDLNELNRLKETALMSALHGDNLEIAKFLLKNGIDINKQNRFGRTALHVAVELDTMGYDRQGAPAPPSRLTEFVLSYHPNTSIRDNDGKTALDLISGWDWDNLISLLKNGE